MTFERLTAHLSGGRDKHRRKLENNTYAERRGTGKPRDPIAVRLHATDVLTFYADGRVTFDTGGWHTVTTKARLNTYAPAGWSVYSERGSWYLHGPGGRKYYFHSGMTVRGGGLRKQDERIAARKEREHQANVRENRRERAAALRHAARCNAIAWGISALGQPWRDGADAIAAMLYPLGEAERHADAVRTALETMCEAIGDAARAPKEVEMDAPADAIDAWHFVARNRVTLRGALPVRAGQTWHVPGHLEMCSIGLHASPTPAQAKRWASGGVVICRVKLWGNVQHGYGKMVGAFRRVEWIADVPAELQRYGIADAEFNAAIELLAPEKAA